MKEKIKTVIIVVLLLALGVSVGMQVAGVNGAQQVPVATTLPTTSSTSVPVPPEDVSDPEEEDVLGQGPDDNIPLEIERKFWWI